MTTITAQATLAPAQLGSYIARLDELGLVYSFNVGAYNYLHGKFELELSVDGDDHNGTKIVLAPDGTWTATTNVVVGEKE